MEQVELSIQDHVYKVDKGIGLLEACRQLGIWIDAPCGGKGTCGNCRVTIKEEGASLWKVVKACDYQLTHSLTMKLEDQEAEKIAVSQSKDKTNDSHNNKSHTIVTSMKKTVDQCPDNEKAVGNIENLGLAVDIGTTTVVLCLIDLNTKKVLAEQGFANPQRLYGADVTSRIGYCRERGEAGVLRLQHILIDQWNSTLDKMFRNINRSLKDKSIKRAVVVANTVMLHLLRGLSPSSMGEAPYEPVTLSEESLAGKDLGLPSIIEMRVLPCHSAFIGADVLVGARKYGLFNGRELNAFIDLGTNGEMLLGNKFNMLACSTAVGPALEGGNMSHGMPALQGAISSFTMDEEGNLVYEIIGGGTARGICGSGYIDLIALLVEAGMIDESGHLETDPYKVTEDVWLTQDDIRQFQMAKGAIAAGLETLIHRFGLTSVDILDRLYIAGGIGEYMNLDYAKSIGMLPTADIPMKATGNTAMQGAIEELLGQSSQLPQHEIQLIDLGNDTFFEKIFIEKMNLGPNYS